MVHDPSLPRPGVPATVTLRCDAGEFGPVRADHLRGAGVLIVFRDGATFDGISAARVDGVWRTVREVVEGENGNAYRVYLDR